MTTLYGFDRLDAPPKTTPKGGDENIYSVSIRKLTILVLAVMSFLLISTSTFAKSSEAKPGWGFGDKNHVHVGPPGQSVFPGGLTQTNNSVNHLSLNVSSNTGGNNANSFEGGPVSIVTGAVSTVVSFVSSMGQNILGV